MQFTFLKVKKRRSLRS